MRAAPWQRGVSFAVGLSGIVAMRGLSPPAAAPAPTLVRAPIPMVILTPPPTPVLLPTVVAAVPMPRVDGCPPIAFDDDRMPIGRELTEEEREQSLDPNGVAVAASSTQPVIAVIDSQGAVHVSIDDGRRWDHVFGDHVAASIAVDDRGRVYATTDGGLGVIDERGRARWSTLACPHEACTKRVVAVPGGVALIEDHAIRISHDGGRRWTALDRDDATEVANQELVFAWSGTLYGVSHEDEMCGWHADMIASIDLDTGAFTNETFNNEGSSPHLDVIEDAGATWLYAARGVSTRIAQRDLIMAKLSPRVGARALFAENDELIELCGVRGRVVAHAYGADRVDAIDASGRAIAVRNHAVMRFSPHFGWRVIFTEPVPEGGD